MEDGFQGVYVLTDNSFRPFARMSTEAGGQAVVRAQPVSLFHRMWLVWKANWNSSSGSHVV